MHILIRHYFLPHCPTPAKKVTPAATAAAATAVVAMAAAAAATVAGESFRLGNRKGWGPGLCVDGFSGNVAL